MMSLIISMNAFLSSHSAYTRRFTSSGTQVFSSVFIWKPLACASGDLIASMLPMRHEPVDFSWSDGRPCWLRVLRVLPYVLNTKRKTRLASRGRQSRPKGGYWRERSQSGTYLPALAAFAAGAAANEALRAAI